MVKCIYATSMERVHIELQRVTATRVTLVPDPIGEGVRIYVYTEGE